MRPENVLLYEIPGAESAERALRWRVGCGCGCARDRSSRPNLPPRSARLHPPAGRRQRGCLPAEGSVSHAHSDAPPTRPHAAQPDVVRRPPSMASWRRPRAAARHLSTVAAPPATVAVAADGGAHADVEPSRAAVRAVGRGGLACTRGAAARRGGGGGADVLCLQEFWHKSAEHTAMWENFARAHAYHLLVSPRPGEEDGCAMLLRGDAADVRVSAALWRLGQPRRPGGGVQ